MKSKTAALAILKFAGQFAFATYGTVILVFSLGYPVAAALDPQGRIVDSMFVAPSFMIPVAFGFLFGYRYGRRLPSMASRLLFVPSMILVGLGIYSNHDAGMPWALAWSKLFGTACTGQGCYSHFGGQVLFTAPFMSALSYAIGSEFGRRSKMFAPLQPGQSAIKWRRGAWMILAVAGVLTLSIIQKTTQQMDQVRFEWSETAGFRYAFVDDADQPRILKLICAPINQSILRQTKPRVSYELRDFGVKRAEGCVYPETLWYLPIVIDLNHVVDSSCGVVVLDRRTRQ